MSLYRSVSMHDVIKRSKNTSWLMHFMDKTFIKANTKTHFLFNRIAIGGLYIGPS